MTIGFGRIRKGRGPRAEDAGQPVLPARALPGGRHHQRPLPGRRLHGARPHAGALDQDGADLQEDQRPHRVLPVGGVPARAASDQQSGQSRHPGGRPRGRRRAWARLRRHRRGRRRAGPRQRRPRPARGLLHGLARDPADPGHRLRHPLRVRHLRSGHRRRLAGRARRHLASHGNPWEIPRPKLAFPVKLRRPHRALHRRPKGRCARAGCRAWWSTASPTTRPSSATASAT
jgi:hypothetical protein